MRISLRTFIIKEYNVHLYIITCQDLKVMYTTHNNHNPVGTLAVK